MNELMLNEYFQWVGFDMAIAILYITYIGIYLGIYFVSPEYIVYLRFLIELYVSLFLIYRFNPWKKTQFTELDKKISYNAGFFLLSTIFF